jgi:D-alanine-D-alanine ligase-like ATP-grasp enzyme
VHVFFGETFAVRIRSDAVDYRYYRTRGSFAKLEPEIELPKAIKSACIEFAAASRVSLAGFDFKIDGEGRWYCLEMNPTPAFESYDRVMEGAIARRILARMS